MDGLTFFKFLLILKKYYLDSYLNKVVFFEQNLNFDFYNEKQGNFYLEFMASPPPSLLFSKPYNDSSQKQLSHIFNSKLKDITYRDYDRLGIFHLEKRRPSGKLLDFKFVLEPMGNYSNAFLLNENDIITYSLTRGNIDPDRDIALGKKYIFPKVNKKYSLSNTGNTSDFNDLVGFYPYTIKLAESYKKDKSFNDIVKIIDEQIRYNDLFYVDENLRISPFAPQGATLNTTITELKLSYKKVKKDTKSELKIYLLNYFNKQIDGYNKTIFHIEEELSNSLQHDIYTDEAELLQNNLHQLKKGLNILQKYTEDGIVNVEYTYSTSIEPYEYINKLYKKVSKLKRAIPILKSRLYDIEQLLFSCKEQIYFIENADLDELNQIKDSIKALKNRKETESKKGNINTKDFIEYKIGRCILYLGKNSQSNHKLVYRFAQPNDTWLHAHNIPSAHGILRSDEGNIPPETIIRAAEIVAASSKNKSESKVEVDYTKRKYLKKPPRTPIGFVTYSKFSTVLVKPDLPIKTS